MKSAYSLLVVGFVIAGGAAGSAMWLVRSHVIGRDRARRPLAPLAAVPGSSPGVVGAQLASAGYEINPQALDDGGYSAVRPFLGTVRDPGSLRDLRDTVRGRAARGMVTLRAQYDALLRATPPRRDYLRECIRLEKSIGLLCMYTGELAKASTWIARAREKSLARGMPRELRGELTALLGIIALRRGEVENCVQCRGPASCIFPISREAVHERTEGSREAVRWFTAYLEESPGDLRVLWLLNIAYMTLGEYPDKVPPAYRLPLASFQSKMDLGRFENVAAEAGLTGRGPNLAGGSVFDDLNGDGRPDLFTTAIDAERGASLFVNRGDGTFEDRSESAGLAEQVYALNVARADFDNDGDLDLLLLRGAWESPMRLSLLRNRGDATFDDVTMASGLGVPIASESAAWGDYDNDGWVDLFVCGEYIPPGGASGPAERDPRNRCRLYRNRGDGTFVDVAAEAGVLNESCAKGAAWGDYDDDGRLDLFVSNMGQPCALFHNEGNGRFVDLARPLGVTGPEASFACWFWDFDNDGRLDLYVNDYRARTAEILADRLGLEVPRPSRPRLYRNVGVDGFRDVSRAVGLDHPMAPMGANFGDIDNDGYLDIFLGTGDMSYSGLDRKLLLKNVEGRSFVDVTTSSGTGHLQKGHGVSFADWDRDGDLDFFVELGGAAPGDRSYNALFRNPGHGRHWLKVKLVGTKTNRAALGARIKVELRGRDGKLRAIHRTVGNNSSFGGNSLVELLGLGECKLVDRLTVSWPTSRTEQTFRDLAADQEIRITEGEPVIEVLRNPITTAMRRD
jgi:hypothetical protein